MRSGYPRRQSSALVQWHPSLVDWTILSPIRSRVEADGWAVAASSSGRRHAPGRAHRHRGNDLNLRPPGPGSIDPRTSGRFGGVEPGSADLD
jgi:hypothetical protein